MEYTFGPYNWSVGHIVLQIRCPRRANVNRAETKSGEGVRNNLCRASGTFADVNVNELDARGRIWDSPNAALRVIVDRDDCPYIRRYCGLHVPSMSLNFNNPRISSNLCIY